MMEFRIIRRSLFIVGLFFLMTISSCYYDNYDDLAVGVDKCDTLSMTYTVNVSPIMTQYCTGCHSGNAPAGNIPLSNYVQVKTAADNGSLEGTIQHKSGYSPMPKNQPSLNNCEINKISAWINQGTQN